jgi:hypothetical protein
MGYKALENLYNITEVVSLDSSSGPVDNIFSIHALHFHHRKNKNRNSSQ